MLGSRASMATTNKIDLMDRADVIEQIFSGNNATESVLWNSQMGLNARMWSSNSCTLAVYLTKGHPPTATSYFSVAKTAMGIMKACLWNPASADIGVGYYG